MAVSAGESDSTDQTTETLSSGTLPPLGRWHPRRHLLQATDDDPADFVSALTNRPIVILFYIAGNADDTKVLDTVNKLRTSFNSYAFLLYDYRDPEAYGSLAQEFQVDYTPFLALVDSSGTLAVQVRRIRRRGDPQPEPCQSGAVALLGYTCDCDRAGYPGPVCRAV